MDPYKQPKEKEFESIYEMYHEDIYKISLYYTKDEQIAEDITQSTFYNLYLHMDYVDPGKIRAYLIRSARNKAYNYLRDGKREFQTGEIDTVMDETTVSYSVEEHYFENVKRISSIKLMQRAMEHLREENESWYELLVLVYCLDKPHEVVAEELGITKEVLYSRLYRAKKWIQKHYNNEYKKIQMYD